jgi:hypothetical protein
MNEREEGPFVFIFPGKSISHHTFFALLVKNLIIISKQLGHPFLWLRR